MKSLRGWALLVPAFFCPYQWHLKASTLGCYFPPRSIDPIVSVHYISIDSMEQRRTRRFKLQLPLEITRTGADRIAAIGLTRNISSTGVLFTAEREPDLGGPIEYVITLNQDDAQSVNLRCIGKVLRAE